MKIVYTVFVTNLGLCYKVGSQIKMVDRILEQEAAIRQVLSGDRKSSHLTPTWQDVDVLESVSKALSPLKEFTDILSGERHVTVSAVKPMLKVLKDSVLAPGTSDTQLTKDIQRRVITYLYEKFSKQETDELLNMATFLDPRFKTDYIDEDEEKELVIERITEEATEMIRKQKGQASEGENSAAAITPVSEPPAKKSKIGTFLKRCQKESPNDTSSSLSRTPLERVQQEIEKYTRDVNPDSESDPLEWWRVNCTLFPCLSKMAQRYLCICATSTPSERVFSTCGNVVTSRRTLLKPVKVNMLVFLSKIF